MVCCLRFSVSIPEKESIIIIIIIILWSKVDIKFTLINAAFLYK
jgi:hypothetical protein